MWHNNTSQLLDPCSGPVALQAFYLLNHENNTRSLGIIIIIIIIVTLLLCVRKRRLKKIK